MDYLAHGFWGYIFFNWTKKPYLAFVFGLLPDTFSWVIYAIYNLFSGGFGRPNLESIPEWVFQLYGVSHSLFVAFGVILLVYLIRKKWFWPMFAWPLAIVMDLFTHSRDFLPTPFLWPVSQWTFPGFSWGNGWFMVLNYSAIIGAFTYLFWFSQDKKRFNHKKKFFFFLVLVALVMVSFIVFLPRP